MLSDPAAGSTARFGARVSWQPVVTSLAAPSGQGRGWCCGWQVSTPGEKGQRTQIPLVHVSSGKPECSLQANILQCGPGMEGTSLNK